jgi:hypothetical protein
MQMMRAFWDAAVALDPSGRDLDEGRRFPLCRSEPLRALFEQRGMQRMDVRAIDVPTFFKDFDDYWSPVLGGQGPAPTYCMSLSAPRLVARQGRTKRNHDSISEQCTLSKHQSDQAGAATR